MLLKRQQTFLKNDKQHPNQKKNQNKRKHIDLKALFKIKLQINLIVR
ncbi:hypothetical protein SAMN03097719_1764 [Pantoea ananatis]|nr:hypothetical protein SAMN03097719_1764 [Pantoea ananatis]